MRNVVHNEPMTVAKELPNFERYLGLSQLTINNYPNATKTHKL